MAEQRPDGAVAAGEVEHPQRVARIPGDAHRAMDGLQRTRKHLRHPIPGRPQRGEVGGRILEVVDPAEVVLVPRETAVRCSCVASGLSSLRSGPGYLEACREASHEGFERNVSSDIGRLELVCPLGVQCWRGRQRAVPLVELPFRRRFDCVGPVLHEPCGVVDIARSFSWCRADERIELVLREVRKPEHSHAVMLFELSVVNGWAIGVMEWPRDEVDSGAEGLAGCRMLDDEPFRAAVPFLIGGFAIRPFGDRVEGSVDVLRKEPWFFDLDVEIRARPGQSVTDLERGPADEPVSDAVLGECVAQTRGEFFEKFVEEIFVRGTWNHGDALASGVHVIHRSMSRRVASIVRPDTGVCARFPRSGAPPLG